MRSLFVVGCLALAACNTTSVPTSPEAKPVDAASPPAAVNTRALAFSAEVNGVEIAAKCTVRGPEFDRSFATPTKMDIPVDSSGRALITYVSCKAGGLRTEAKDIPGPETRTVTARFGGSGLFGDKALLFGPSGNLVQYFVRDVDEGVIRVGRAPEP